MKAETCKFLNPLSPNIHLQILQTGLYTFAWSSLLITSLQTFLNWKINGWLLLKSAIRCNSN